MRKLFVSYARENKPEVDELVRHLGALGYQAWIDSALRGGQTWWEEILRRIAECDVFLVIVSGYSLNSVACRRELQWALSLDRPMLPVALEQLPEALPRSLAMRQIVDYSQPGPASAFAVAGGLAAIAAAPPLPDRLPEPPPAPLSYLSDLVDRISQLEQLSSDEQRAILSELEPALRSADPEESRGGRYVANMLSNRADIDPDVREFLSRLDTSQDNVPASAAAEHADLLADPLWADALSAYFNRRWLEAVERFEELSGRYPDESSVERRLKEARRQHDIAMLSDQADAAARDENWSAAVSALERLIAVDPGHQDAEARLDQARTAQRRKSLVDEMTALHQAGQWDAVVAAARELSRLDPQNPDPGGIVSDAQAKLREPQLAQRYADAIDHLDNHEWREAVELFTAIERDQPGYRDAAALLETAEQQWNLASWNAKAETAEAQGDWQSAIIALEKVCAFDPTFRGAGERLQRARAAAEDKTPEIPVAVDPGRQRAIDELLDGAILAMNRGDRTTADALANRVLEVDRGNTEAEELLAAPVGSGEIRRMTILFADLVDSTVLSTKVEPEIYRTVVGTYRDDVREIVERYDGHIPSTKGDGLLAVFGYPHAHEDDVRRAVHAGLDIASRVSKLSERVNKQFGFDISVRVGVHRGVTYVDTAQDDVYGVGANLAARMCSLAEPGTVAVSEPVEQLIDDQFELMARVPKPVKGLGEPVIHYRVIAERDASAAPLGPLIGRKPELAYLEQSWRRASSGTLEIPGVIFQGDAGIGKSRLAWSAVGMAEGSHAVVLHLNGSPLHTGVGLRPIRRLLERQCGIAGGSDGAERIRQLKREIARRGLDESTMVPLLAPVLGIAPESGYEGVHAEGRKLHDQIAAAVHSYLLACMQQGPTLLVVEDMHWFDDDSSAVVNALLGEKLGWVLIVMTGRELSSLPDSPRAQVFELKPLTDGEADELIIALDPDMNAEARRAVRRRCDGVPLYIEEVVEKLEQQRIDAAQPVEVPDTLYEALFARLRSSDEAIRLLAAAAVIGRAFERSLLLSVVDASVRDVVDQVVNDLVDGRVLEPVDRDTWRFRHELLREVAAELSPPSQRRLLHSRVADALVAAAADGDPGWSTVAGHYERADRHGEAATAYERASAGARQRGALAEARAYLSQAISQIGQAPKGPARDRLEVTLRLSHGFLVSAAEGVSSPDAAADFERCLQLSGSNLHENEAIATVIALYAYYALRADLRRVQQLLEYLGELRTHMTPERRARFEPFSHAAYGMLGWYRGEFDTAKEKLEAAASSRTEESAGEIDAVWYMPNEATASVYTHLALADYVIGDFAGTEAELAKTAQRCETLDFPQGAFSLAYARQMEVLIRIEAGQLEQAKEVAVTLGSEAEQRGFDSWSMISAAQQATVDAMAALAGGALDPTTAQSHLATVKVFVDIWRALEVRSLITFYDAVLARLSIAAGQLPEARERIEIALTLAKETGMSFYDAELLRIRAGTHDDDADRKADLLAAIELARTQRAVIFELRAAEELFQAFGEREPLAEAITRFPQGSTWPELARASTLLDA